MNITPDNCKPMEYPIKTLQEELLHLEASITKKGQRTTWKPIIADINDAIKLIKHYVAITETNAQAEAGE